MLNYNVPLGYKEVWITDALSLCGRKIVGGLKVDNPAPYISYE